MIVFVKDDTGCDATEGGGMRLKIFVNIFERNGFIAHNVFAYFWYAETAFVIGPFFAIQRFDMGIDKYLFDTGLIGVAAFFIVVLVFEHLGTIYEEEADIAVDLGSGQSNTIAGIKRFPHIGDQLLQVRVIRGYILAHGSED